jgi:hypothetical protein
VAVSCEVVVDLSHSEIAMLLLAYNQSVNPQACCESLGQTADRDM